MFKYTEIKMCKCIAKTVVDVNIAGMSSIKWMKIMNMKIREQF